MKYLKHYWIDLNFGKYSTTYNPVEKRHPEKEFPGLDVRFWLIDENDIDICLSAVPDDTEVSDVFDDENKKVVQVLTEDQFNSIAIPIQESHNLFVQSMQQIDDEIKSNLQQQASLKKQESEEALYNL
jgi:hypothetical protein